MRVPLLYRHDTYGRRVRPPILGGIWEQHGENRRSQPRMSILFHPHPRCGREDFLGKERTKIDLKPIKPEDSINGNEEVSSYACGCQRTEKEELEPGETPPLWMMAFPLPGGVRMRLTQCNKCLKLIGGGVEQMEAPQSDPQNIILSH